MLPLRTPFPASTAAYQQCWRISTGTESSIWRSPLLTQPRFYLYFGNGDGTFRARVTHYTGTEPVEALAAADVNHDGKTDLLVLTASDADGRGSTNLEVFFANADGVSAPDRQLTGFQE